jgi:hypothetical protein
MIRTDRHHDSLPSQTCYAIHGLTSETSESIYFWLAFDLHARQPKSDKCTTCERLLTMPPNALPCAPPRPSIYDVAVIGFGPTGATLANLLAGQGLTVLVLERDPTIYPLPRAIHMDAETMRIFQSAGIGSELSAHVLPAAGVRFISGSGRVLHAFDRSPTHGPQG